MDRSRHAAAAGLLLLVAACAADSGAPVEAELDPLVSADPFGTLYSYSPYNVWSRHGVLISARTVLTTRSSSADLERLLASQLTVFKIHDAAGNLEEHRVETAVDGPAGLRLVRLRTAPGVRQTAVARFAPALGSSVTLFGTGRTTTLSALTGLHLLMPVAYQSSDWSASVLSSGRVAGLVVNGTSSSVTAARTDGAHFEWLKTTLAGWGERLTDGWQNPRNPLDVNDDGHVSSIDSLLIVNELNGAGARLLSGANPSPAAFIDVSGDGYLSPIDSLRVVNELNRLAALR